MDKKELEKMLKELKSDLKITSNRIKHFVEEKKRDRVSYERKLKASNDEIDSLSLKKSEILDNIDKVQSLINYAEKN